MDKLDSTLARITRVSPEFMEMAEKELDGKTKPKGSLGRLEELARQMAAIQKSMKPRCEKKAIYVFAGDHGVTEEGISAFPREVTPQMVMNFLDGGAGVNVLARHAGADVHVVDVGVDYDFGEIPGLIQRKIARGTANFTKGPAMSMDETIAAIITGIELADECAEKGVQLAGTGDMGIGNTTPSSAIIAAFSGIPARELTHKGSGISDDALERKIKVIEKGIEINLPDPRDPLDILSKVGGFEIAAIAGFVLGCAANSVAVVMDGFISTAGGLVASELHPNVRDYIFAAHRSVERGHSYMLERISVKPLLDLELRLGEGTGSALAMTLVEAGVKVIREMATFEQAGVSKG